jgi:hypothetical protein
MTLCQPLGAVHHSQKLPYFASLARLHTRAWRCSSSPVCPANCTTRAFSEPQHAIQRIASDGLAIQRFHSGCLMPAQPVTKPRGCFRISEANLTQGSLVIMHSLNDEGPESRSDESPKVIALIDFWSQRFSHRCARWRPMWSLLSWARQVSGRALLSRISPAARTLR